MQNKKLKIIFSNLNNSWNSNWVAYIVIGRIIIGVIPILTNQKKIFLNILDNLSLNWIFSLGNRYSKDKKIKIPIITIKLLWAIKVILN